MFVTEDERERVCERKRDRERERYDKIVTWRERERYREAHE